MIKRRLSGRRVRVPRDDRVVLMFVVHGGDAPRRRVQRWHARLPVHAAVHGVGRAPQHRPVPAHRPRTSPGLVPALVVDRPHPVRHVRVPGHHAGHRVRVHHLQHHHVRRPVRRPSHAHPVQLAAVPHVTDQIHPAYGALQPERQVRHHESVVLRSKTRRGKYNFN